MMYTARQIEKGQHSLPEVKCVPSDGMMEAVGQQHHDMTIKGVMVLLAAVCKTSDIVDGGGSHVSTERGPGLLREDTRQEHGEFDAR